MLKTKFVLGGIFCLFIFSFWSLAFAGDPGEPDTCWLSQIPSVGPNQTVIVSVMADADQSLAGIVLPFKFYDPDNNDIVCDSIVFSSWVTDASPDFSSKTIDTTNYQMNFGAVWFSGGMPAGRDTLARLFFSTGPGWLANKGVVVDSTTYYPGGARLEFTDEATTTTYNPIFKKGCLGAAITVTSPNGGELFYVDESFDINWFTVLFDANVKIEYSTNGGGSWLPVISSTSNDGVHPWSVPDTPSPTCLIRVSDASDGVPWDKSDSVFSIPDFDISAHPDTSKAEAGESTSFWVKADSTYGFAKSINLSLSGLPSGATESFVPNPVDPGDSSLLTIETEISTPAGHYTLTITGTGSQQRTTEVTLVVNVAPSSFDLLNPTDEDTVSTLTPTLSWEEAIDPDPQDDVTYTLYYTLDPTFTTTNSIPGLTGTSRQLPPLDDDTLYHWKVVAEDKWGDSTWSDQTWEFFVYYPEQPLAFSLVYPPNYDSLNQTSVELKWRSTTDPDPGDSVVYDLYYDTRTGFPSPTIVSDLSDTAYTISVKDDSTYFWKVLAKDTNTSGRWSSVFRFKIGIPDPPGAFSLVSPSDGDTVILHPTLSWQNSVDPDPGDVIEYIMNYSIDSTFASFEAETTFNTNITLPELTNDTFYYWKVKAVDLFDLETWCTESYFSFFARNFAPGEFSLISPDSGEIVSTLEPTFRWHKSEDLDPFDPISYVLYYSLNSDFSDSEEVSVSDTLYTPSTLLDDTIYFWKVKAEDSYGLASWSDQLNWQFETYYPEPPFDFSLLVPSYDSTLSDSSLELHWQPTTDPDPGDVVVFDLYYDTHSGFANPTTVSDIADTTSSITVKDDSTYFWKVLARDTNTSGRWSTEVFKFNIYVPEPPNPFNLVSPSDGDTTSGLSPELMWEEATDPDPGDFVRYNLYYTEDPDSDFVDADSVVDLDETSYTLPELDYGTVYLWKVKANDTNTEGSWSVQSLWSFYVPSCIQGDVNGDTKIEVADAIYLANYLFKGGPEPKPIIACGDVDCNDKVEIADAIWIANYLFKGWVFPPC
ncbi:MAG: hypothetical protein AMJ90_02540 [candidate division Zixibacteria bacterium SM23_73_2]|nr:MAG: hypothetical protein AMJ90_02540 [candidate division Zixibacteria bacterium SM23_73_2]